MEKETEKVKQIKSGDVIGYNINNIRHWAIVLLDKYPKDEYVLVAPISTSYCSTKEVFKITHKDFKPLLRESMVSLQFRTVVREKAINDVVGRIENPKLINKLINKMLSEYNHLRHNLKKQCINSQ